MPTFLSSIPVLSSLPNPLHLFNSDDSDQQQHPQHPQSPNQSSHSPLRDQDNSLTPVKTSASFTSSVRTTPAPAAENTGPVARLSSILSRGFDALTPSTPNHSVSSDAETTTTPVTPRVTLTSGGDSPTGSPSTTTTPVRKSATTVVIAPEADDSPRSQQERSAGRSRGLSVATSATATSGETRRKRRVETFVLVKPPPTSAKNPLNLQVQLVVPARPGRSIRGPDGAKVNGSAASESSGPSKSGSTDTADSRTSAASSESSPSNSAAGSPPKRGASLSAGSAGSDADADAADEDNLARRSSSASTRSIESSAASSSASSSSSKQRIIPLYNLAVHNVVQPTMVTDAGTDSKVAKFLKRSLDITGVGILEPMEVWLPLNNIGESSPRPSMETTATPSRRPVSMISNLFLLSPAPSRVDESKRSSVDLRPSQLVPPHRDSEDGAKKFFGKIFRKRSSAEQIGERRGLGRIVSSKSSHFLAAEAGSNPSTLQAPSPASVPGSPVVHFSGSEKDLVAHPTFGLAPAVLHRRDSHAQLNANGAIVGLTSENSAADEEEITLARSARPVGYTWTVRKWAKKNTEGWAAHIVAAAAAGLDLVAGSLPGDGADEVVFEWVKMRVTPGNEFAGAVLRRHPASDGMDMAAKARLSRPVRPKQRLTPGPSREGSPHGSRTSLTLRSKNNASRAASLAMDPGATLAAESDPSSSALSRPSSAGARAPAPVPERRASDSASRSDEASVRSVPRTEDEDAKVPGSAGASADDKLCAAIEAGYDSDPEDSETPWCCSVWVRRTGQRQFLATLTPAPHHPKVVGVLKMPTGIKSLTLAHLPAEGGGHALGGGAGGKPELAARVREEVCLTEENIKDVVNITAMWLVAREEFSGFGRKEKRRA